MKALLLVAALIVVALPVGSAGTAAGDGFTVGDLFVADHGAISEFTPDGAIVRTYTDPRVAQLIDLAFDNAGNDLYATDAIAHDVKVFDRSGTMIRTFGAGILSQPHGIAVHPNGDPYVADTGGGKIEVFDAAGNHLRTIGPVPVPLNLAFSPDGNRLYVSESNYFAGVQVFDLSDGGRFLGTFGDTAAQVGLTLGLAVAPDGTLYVGDGIFGGGTDSVKTFNRDGSFAGTFASGLNAPIDLTFDDAGNIWLTNTNDFSGDQIYAYTTGGNLIRTFGGAELTQPTGLAFLLPVRTPAPIAAAGPDQLLECAGHGGTTVTLDGSGSSGDVVAYTWRSSDGTVVGTASTLTVSLLPGTYVFALTVEDVLGRSAQDSVTVTIRDSIPPTLTLMLSRVVLWPPNHTMAGVSAALEVSDICDASPKITLVSITSSEPDSGLGDGDKPDDIQGASFGSDDHDFSLRAERGGSGPGRTYTVTYSAEDAGGNVTTASAVVTVPHDMPMQP